MISIRCLFFEFVYMVSEDEYFSYFHLDSSMGRYRFRRKRSIVYHGLLGRKIVVLLSIGAWMSSI